MSDALPPIPFTYDGEAMVPLNAHWARRADALFVVGETYVLVPHEERSPNSHKHQFAEINEAWQSLPENLSALYPTPDSLRKYALIRAGFANVTTFAVTSGAEAVRLAAAIQTIDPFSVVEVRRDAVLRYTARSQSMKAMGKADFQRSKQAVLEIVAEMIGVSSSDLSREAGRMVA
jgi:hypothetical protein